MSEGWTEEDGNDGSRHRTLSHLSYVHLWLRIIIVSNHQSGQSVTALHLISKLQQNNVQSWGELLQSTCSDSIGMSE